MAIAGRCWSTANTTIAWSFSDPTSTCSARQRVPRALSCAPARIRVTSAVPAGVPRHPRTGQVLLDYLAAGDSLDTFLDDFPSVRREQAIALLELTRELMPKHSRACACCSTSASHAAWHTPSAPSTQWPR